MSRGDSINKHWNEETRLIELKKSIDRMGHFPTYRELRTNDYGDLSINIIRNGGLFRYAKLLGYNNRRKPPVPPQKPEGFVCGYTDDEILGVLKEIEMKTGHFPTYRHLKHTKEYTYLIAEINKNGGLTKFRLLSGHDYIRKPNGYYTDEIILKEISKIINCNRYFPSTYELQTNGNKQLVDHICKNGGINKYRKLMGYSDEFNIYISELMSYCGRRGKNTENIVYEILTKYCELNSLRLPTKNVRLSKSNVIEFVCNTNKKIGIDVTNTICRGTVYKKWHHKDYYKYLDELWIIVFSNVFTIEDYKKWNAESPSNVYVYSIEDFCNELQYDLDEKMKNKIEKYKSCTFHTKEQYKKEKQEADIISASQSTLLSFESADPTDKSGTRMYS